MQHKKTMGKSQVHAKKIKKRIVNKKPLNERII